jgi:hypothetical protein
MKGVRILDSENRRAEFKHSALAFIRDSEVEITDKWLRKSREEIKFINRILNTPYEEIKTVFTIDELFIFYKRKEILSNLVTAAYNASMENSETSMYIKMLKSTKRIFKSFKITDFSKEFFDMFKMAFNNMIIKE